MSPIIEQIIAAFHERGATQYGNEEVTQLQHALQTATLAMQDNAHDSLVTAALLHDIGHVLHQPTDQPGIQDNLDDDHESIGSKFLSRYFGPAVADPVRLHVLAKRYLCTTQPEYQQQLSPTSLKSYHDQGGRMSREERQEFEGERHFQAAIQLRHWDDAAKDPSAITRRIEDFTVVIEASLCTDVE